MPEDNDKRLKGTLRAVAQYAFASMNGAPWPEGSPPLEALQNIMNTCRLELEHQRRLREADEAPLVLKR